jgi:hypothetical protein
MTDKKNHGNSELYRRLLLEVRPYCLHLGAILSLSIPLSPLPTFVKGVLPNALTQSSDAILISVVGLTIVIALLSGLQRVAPSCSGLEFLTS